VDPAGRDGGPIEVRTAGGHRLKGRLGHGGAVSQQSYAPRWLVELEVELPAEADDGGITAEQLNQVLAASGQAERPLPGTPIVKDDRVIGLVVSDRNLSIDFAPLPLDGLESAAMEAFEDPSAAERVASPFTVVWRPGVSTLGLLDVNLRAPGRDGRPLRLVPRAEGSTERLVVLDLGSGGPDIEVRGPLALDLDSVGDAVEMTSTSTEGPWTIVARRRPGRSEAWSWRRALRNALALLRKLDADPDTRHASFEHRFAFGVSGLGDLDAGEVADLIAFEWGEPFEVIEWFAERGVIELMAESEEDWSTARNGPRRELANRMTWSDDARGDNRRGTFGWVAEFNGRLLSQARQGDAFELRVSAVDGATPVSGWVAFHVPAQEEPIRVRARDGVASLPIPLTSAGGVVGAVIEREGLELELRLEDVPSESDEVQRTMRA
jgi:hypothetical protein